MEELHLVREACHRKELWINTDYLGSLMLAAIAHPQSFLFFSSIRRTAITAKCKTCDHVLNTATLGHCGRSSTHYDNGVSICYTMVLLQEFFSLICLKVL